MGLWTVTIPCDGCRRQFPLLGSLTLKHPEQQDQRPRLCLHLTREGDRWRAAVVDGAPTQQPTAQRPVDGTKKKGKSAPACSASTSTCSTPSRREGLCPASTTDEMVVAADLASPANSSFREPTAAESRPRPRGRWRWITGGRTRRRFRRRRSRPATSTWSWPAVTATDLRRVSPTTAGCDLPFIETAQRRPARSTATSRRGHQYRDYARVLASFAASTLCRRLRRSTLRSEAHATR